MGRKPITTTINVDLYKEAQILAIREDKNINDLIEEGLRYVIEKYNNDNKEK